MWKLLHTSFSPNPLKQKRQNVRHSFNSGFRLKDFPRNIFTVFRYQSIKITWFLTTFIDFDFYPLTTQGLTGPTGCNCTRIYSPTLFLRGGRSFVIFNFHSIVNKFTICVNSGFIFQWTDEQMFLPIWIDQIGKNQDKSLKETSVSSISTDWYQLNQIYRFLLIYRLKNRYRFFINWLLQVK